MEAKLLVVFAGSEDGQSGKNVVGAGASRRPWRTRLCSRAQSEGEEREWQRECGRVWRGCSGLAPIHIERGHAEGTQQDEEARALHGCPRVLPLTHFAEQLAGDGVASVERVFGLFPCRIRRWAKYKVCQTRAALHFSFKCHGH